MEIDLALLADAATVDVSGKMNILGIFDRIAAATFPVRHPRISLILRFTAGMNEAGSHKIEIVLRDPEGGEVVRVTGEIHIGPGAADTGGRVRVPQVLNFDQLVLPMGGRYAFDVSVDGEHHLSIPLMLHEAVGGRGARA
jgi:hypothetical protein